MPHFAEWDNDAFLEYIMDLENGLFTHDTTFEEWKLIQILFLKGE
jgi:hypothetical protein